MEKTVNKPLEEYTIPILDQIDRETGERIPTFLFGEEGLNAYVESVQMQERTEIIAEIQKNIHREITRAAESTDYSLVQWHMIRYGCLNELLDAIERKKGRD